MSVELRPLNVACNIRCHYCYQEPERSALNPRGHYDLEAMKGAVERLGGPFTLFGGEPLLVPLEDLESLWAWGLLRYGGNRVQTNGTLITDEHVRLFHRYRVHVGISLDGPGELNGARWAGTPERTAESTARAQAAIHRLCREGIPPSVIITLSRANAAPEHLERLCAWIVELEAAGVTRARVHVLEADSDFVRSAYSLTAEENVRALTALAELERHRLTRLRFDLFQEIRALLLGEDGETSCVWNACDPYTTHAVQGVEGHGQMSNCGRTNKDGVGLLKAQEDGYERYLALYHTPQEHGGCRGCRFFFACKGQCPGTSMDGDWRNRSEHCPVWMALFERAEAELAEEGALPLSLHPGREALERTLLGHWAHGEHVRVAQAAREAFALA